jgi:hypothetical protein
MGPLAKASKKCTADQKQKKDGNSPDRYGLSEVTPLGKVYKKCMPDQNQKNVKKEPEVPEWPAVVSNHQSVQVFQEVTGHTQAGNV